MQGTSYQNFSEPEVRKILEGVEPSNDVCESILGLNDYLHTAIPNMSQAARSNLIEVKINHTISWLNDLPCKDQELIVSMAVERL